MENDKKKVNYSHVSECREFDNNDFGHCQNNASVKPNNRSKLKNPIISLFIGICAIFGIGGCTHGLQFFFKNILGLGALPSAVIVSIIIIIGSPVLAIIYLERRSNNEQKRHP